MVFYEKSGLVNVWVRLIKDGKRTLDEVPDLLNLRDAVQNLLAQWD